MTHSQRTQFILVMICFCVTVACSVEFERPKPDKSPKNVTADFLRYTKENPKYESMQGETLEFSGKDNREVKAQFSEEVTTQEAQFICDLKFEGRVAQIHKVDSKSKTQSPMTNYELTVTLEKVKSTALSFAMNPNTELHGKLIERQAESVCDSKAYELKGKYNRHVFSVASFNSGHIEFVRNNTFDSPTQLNNIFISKRSNGFDVTERFYRLFGSEFKQTNKADNPAYAELDAQQKQILFGKSAFNADGAEHGVGFLLDINKIFITTKGIEFEVTKVFEEKAQQNPDAPDLFAQDSFALSFQNVLKNLNEAIAVYEAGQKAKKVNASQPVAIVNALLQADGSVTMKLSQEDVEFVSPEGRQKELRNNKIPKDSRRKQPIMF